MGLFSPSLRPAKRSRLHAGEDGPAAADAGTRRKLQYHQQQPSSGNGTGMGDREAKRLDEQHPPAPDAPPSRARQAAAAGDGVIAMATLVQQRPASSSGRQARAGSAGGGTGGGPQRPCVSGGEGNAWPASSLEADLAAGLPMRLTRGTAVKLRQVGQGQAASGEGTGGGAASGPAGGAASSAANAGAGAAGGSADSARAQTATAANMRRAPAAAEGRGAAGAAGAAGQGPEGAMLRQAKRLRQAPRPASPSCAAITLADRAHPDWSQLQRPADSQPNMAAGQQHPAKAARNGRAHAVPTAGVSAAAAAAAGAGQQEAGDVPDCRADTVSCTLGGHAEACAGQLPKPPGSVACSSRPAPGPAAAADMLRTSGTGLAAQLGTTLTLLPFGPASASASVAACRDQQHGASSKSTGREGVGGGAAHISGCLRLLGGRVWRAYAPAVEGSAAVPSPLGAAAVQPPDLLQPDDPCEQLWPSSRRAAAHAASGPARAPLLAAASGPGCGAQALSTCGSGPALSASSAGAGGPAQPSDALVSLFQSTLGLVQSHMQQRPDDPANGQLLVALLEQQRMLMLANAGGSGGDGEGGGGGRPGGGASSGEGDAPGQGGRVGGAALGPRPDAF